MQMSLAQNVDGFSANVVAKFFSFLPGPPALWTLSAAATQICGAALLAIGVFSRPVAASMSATMAAARHACETSAPLGWPRHPPLGLSREAMLSLPRLIYAASHPLCCPRLCYNAAPLAGPQQDECPLIRYSLF
jgi:hypothetical protein